MQTNETVAPQGDGWLNAFWDQPVPPATAAETAVPVAQPPARLPLPEPGTVFLLVMAVVTALWQRLRRRWPTRR
jgi:hypothetical protein